MYIYLNKYFREIHGKKNINNKKKSVQQRMDWKGGPVARIPADVF